MQKFDSAYFDAGIERRGTECVKWDAMAEETGDPEMIPMWVADMDFPSPPAIQEAIGRVAAQGTWGYTRNGKDDAAALCEFWSRRHGIFITEDQVLLSPCVVSGIRIAIQTLTQPGEAVLIHTPVYGPFYDSIRQTGRQLVESPLVEENGRWQIDFAGMEAAMDREQVRAVLFCSPHNPCGRVWTKGEMQRVLEMCKAKNAALIVDEIHADFVYGPAVHTSVLSLAGKEDRIVMLCAASKTFNVAGLQQSSMVSKNPEIVKRLKEQRDCAGITFGNPFALAATRAAYRDCDAWLDGLMQYLTGNRDLVMAHAAKWPGVRMTEMEATYLMWLDCRALNMPQDKLLEQLRAAHVYVTDGRFFGPAGDGFIRLNIGCPRAQVEAALKQMDQVLAK
ncbi:MAG: pyridoxal phosphate-dependent aminotransferase [Clostridia bacterium]|nr:pyridoxal phosphate-dependent aminotransferase [Clostridia bacterium]